MLLSQSWSCLLACAIAERFRDNGAADSNFHARFEKFHRGLTMEGSFGAKKPEFFMVNNHVSISIGIVAEEFCVV